MNSDTPVEFQNHHVGWWEDTSWRKAGADCFYNHPAGNQILPCRILYIEDKDGQPWRAYCNAMGITGRFTGRFIDIGKLQRTPTE